MQHILITGGAGFIGSHVVRRFVRHHPDKHIINLDLLTYAGNLANLKDIEDAPNYTFVKCDISDAEQVERVFSSFPISAVIHLAAESHVDRSITDPLSFVRTNVIGTVNLLLCSLKSWKDNLSEHRFYHVSTDEVYGSLHQEGTYFWEDTPYDPQSPYSASKASSDHFVRAFANTYKLPIVISNCSNNYGPNQFPEKLIPLMINNIQKNKALPVYGKGENVRDWMYVLDHAAAIEKIFFEGRNGETYNIGGINEWRNIDLVRHLCQVMDRKLGRNPGESEKLITFVTDRAGHDLRYAIQPEKLQKELGWEPTVTFEEGLEATVDWYLANQEWLDNVTSGEYQHYYRQQYQSA